MIRLFKNYYADPDPARNAELLEVQRRDQADRLLAVHGIDGRPTFADIFRDVNETTGPDDVSVIANADCSVAHEDTGLMEQIKHDEAWALTRWDDTEDGLKIFSDDSGKPRIDTADCWVFRGPIREKTIRLANFPMGIRGCDNRLAAILNMSQYRAGNPSLTIKVIHLHRTPVRHYDSKSKAVPPPYLRLPPHELGQTCQYR